MARTPHRRTAPSTVYMLTQFIRDARQQQHPVAVMDADYLWGAGSDLRAG